MSTTKSPLISLQGVSKTFSDDPLDYKDLVLKNVDLEIFPGEFIIIFGPSGSGKSTLLNLMAGLEFPTTGTIKVRRHNLAQLDNEALAKYHRMKMGMVFQSFNLIKSLNVWENVALPQTAQGIGYNLRKKHAMRLLKLLNIESYADRHANEISGGEQQRVAIARALINNPYFLLVDEPTGNLDTESANEVMHLLHDINRHADHTVVLVTHNPDYLPYATRVIHITDGQITKEETPKERISLPTKKLDDDAYEALKSYKDEP
jgi:putative ABC transport system ATP-binding protein